MKYVHLVYKISNEMKNALEEIPRRGGMYNWMFAFKGTILPIAEARANPSILEDFDVVQINLSPVDQLLVQQARMLLPKSTSTLLIGNNDYVCEAWDTWQQHPLQYLQNQELCDGVFGTEPYQTSFMRDDAYTIPHPHWIEMLKRIGNDDLELDRFKVGVLYHWWESKSYNASLIMEKLKRKFPKLISRLYAYKVMGTDKSTGWNKTMFDKTIPLMNYPDFIRSLQTNRFVYEHCSYHTYGRTSVDCAALGIPMVGSDRVESMRRCFPNMCADPYDARAQLSIMERVLTDKEWLQEQMDLAYENCEYYNYDNSKKRYMSMVSDIRMRLQ